MGTGITSGSSCRRFARCVCPPDSGNRTDSLASLSGPQFFSPLSFPDVLDLGLRVARLGTSSVTYEVGVFKATSESVGGNSDEDAPAAVGGYTHVFVDKQSRASVAMNARTRVGLEKLVTVVNGTRAKL